MNEKSIKKVKIGIVSFAHPHAESYANALKQIENVELCGIFDDDKSRGGAKASYYKTKFYSNFDEMLKKEEPDAVIITSENVKHSEQAIIAMKEGVNVLCEKPIATTLEDADKIVSIVNKSKVTFQTCYVMRYHRVALTIKELLESGKIGNISLIVGTNKLNIDRILIEPWFTNPELSGGGAIMDHTVHLADLMRWFLKEEARYVYTKVGDNVFSQLKVEDNFFTIIEFDKAIGSIDGSWCMPSAYPTWGDVTMTIYGDEGVIFMDAFKQNITLISSEGKNNIIKWHYYGCNADLEMIKDFIECIITSRKPRATVIDGRQGVEITIASYLSMKNNKPIKLPL
ncbi:MAG: Gfo/Idh/MocA family oxidoreductase [Candidatus Methanomethylicaceae archaeon]